MANSSTIITASVTAILTSGLTSLILQEFWHSKVRRDAKKLQEKYEICDNFCSYVEKCQASGGGFWSKNRDELPADTVANVLFLQDRTEGAYHVLAGIGYDKKKDIIDLFDLLTGGEYDELNRLAQPETASKIAILSAKICNSVDKFKYEFNNIK